MKRTLLCIPLLLLLAAVLCLGTFAAEKVLYENDFSNPATLSDFKQYRLRWEIKNGGLCLTDTPTDTMPYGLDGSVYAHILYQPKEPLVDYIVEADYMNLQTAGGVIFRADHLAADEQADGHYGYIAFVGTKGDQGALGCSGWSGRYLGNFNVGNATTACAPGANAHVKVIVKGDRIKVDITNKDTGKSIYSYAYTIRRAANDAQWMEGTVGFRMLTALDSLGLHSVGKAHFDNLKITTANEVTLEELTTVATVETAAPIAEIDTSSVKTVYTNTFDDEIALKDFKQFGSLWGVRDGKLYLASAVRQSYVHILYSGDEALTGLADYVMEFDMYNTQSAGGGIFRSDLARADDGANGFYGYLAFVSTDGTRIALGYGKPDGNYGGNMKLSGGILQAGSNLHFTVAVKGEYLQCVVTDLDSGKELWRTIDRNVVWEKGTFGFRLLGKRKDGLNNLNTTAFDNLKISVWE